MKGFSDFLDMKRCEIWDHESWSRSVTQSCPTLWTPWTAACQTSLSFTVSQSWLKFLSIESMMPSNHLILCRALLSCSVTKAGLILFWNLSLWLVDGHLLLPCPPMIFSLCTCVPGVSLHVQISSSCKNIRQIELGSTLRASFESHILRYWALTKTP